jgi:penicillin-binding protein 1A
VNRLLKFSILAAFLFALFVSSTGAVLWYLWSSNLPYIGSIKEYNPPIITEIYSGDGEAIGRFWDEKRILVSLEDVPQNLIDAFVAAEDARFFEHEGVDLMGIVRAFFKNVVAGKIAQGGSTITQQVTRSLLLENREKTYRRKAREAILSLQIEKSFSKERILFLYLNQIYLGHGAYGVEAAARTYFNKKAEDLELAESALLAGLPQAPSRYSPLVNFDKAKGRQRYVLQRMREEGYITEEEQRGALQFALTIQPTEKAAFEQAPYFAEYVRQYLQRKYGREVLYRGGLKVYTTLDLKMQQAAQKAVKRNLAEFDKREGFRGPLRHLPPEERQAFLQASMEALAEEAPEVGSIVEGLVESVDDGKKEVIVRVGEGLGQLPFKEMKWARVPDHEVAYYDAKLEAPGKVLQEGDVILVRIKGKGSTPYVWKLSLEQKPEIQGALLCMDVKTGRIKAMVGGRDFSDSQFNRAIQARRQPGSAFKPIIYAAALDSGMNPASIILDAPYISSMKPDEEEQVWKPKNYAEKFFGPTLFRTALIKSRNVITVKILRKIGVNQAVEYAQRMGIESDLSPDLSLALGSSGLSLAEITRAYAVFANGGVMIEPIFINRIEDRSGEIIEERQPSTERVISEDTAYIMTDLLKAVIQEGTGWRAKALKRPAAGKTGTTNDMRDAWFLGFTPHLAVGAWVGYDDRKPMGKGETGSRAACPMWLYFLKDVLKDRPVEDFTVPEGVVFAKIDASTGLLASQHSRQTVFQAFKEGQEPKKHSVKPKAPKSGQFSQFDMDFD